MNEDNRYEYTVRRCDSDDTEGLEEILNELSMEGWELYSLNEVESEDGEFQYLCIFNKEIKSGFDDDEDQIVDTGDFKTRMNKLLRQKDDLYEECRFLQKNIKEQNQKIRDVKDRLDQSEEDIDREELNEKISSNINELRGLKSKLSEILSPENMYNRISQDMLTVYVSHELSELVDNDKDGDLIAESVRLRQQLADKLGYVLPKVHFVISDEISENEYQIVLRNLKVTSGIVYPKHKRFFLGQSNIQEIPTEAIGDDDPITDKQIFWLPEEQTKDFWESGLSPAQVIMNHLELIALKYVDEILNYDDVLNYIALLEDDSIYLVNDLLQGAITMGDLRFIFSNLIKEKVPVKDVLYIFEKLNDLSKRDCSVEEIYEELRIKLKRYICSNISDESGVIYSLKVPKLFEKVITAYKENKKDKKVKEEVRKFVDFVSKKFKSGEFNDSSTVIVSKPVYRKMIFDILHAELLNINVLSDDELAEEFTIQEI